jgi:XamI restriction endonuclease
VTVAAEHIANAAKAKALYTDKQQPKGLLADWHFGVRSARRDVASALRESSLLFDMAGALEKNCNHSLVFRHLVAPPMSQDQFKLVCPQWSKQSENGSRPLSKLAAKETVEALLPRLDPGLVGWVLAKRPPSRNEIRTVFKVAAALIAQQRVATARRTRLSFDQEYAVIQILEDEGWTRLPSRLIDTRAAVPPKHFMHKTRFATKTRPQEVDVACGLKDTFVLAMECKVTNDETNSVKRVNDVLKKATAWHDHWGSFVRTAAVLEGVVHPKDAQRLTDAGIEVFWSHDLERFRGWLAAALRA